MKKIIVLFSYLSILCCSCSKSNDANVSSSISGSIDGTGATFNSNVKVIYTNPSGAYSISIVGFEGSSISNQIGIAVTSTEPITPGVYSENSSTGTKTGTVSYVQKANPYPYINYFSQTNPTSVTISAISATSIQGTFSGDVYLTSGSGVTTTKKVITNGAFNIRL